MFPPTSSPIIFPLVSSVMLALQKILTTFVLNIGGFILIFIPSVLDIFYPLLPGLFVMVSWMSFLIPMEEIGGRMSLLIILFLLLVNIFNTVATNTPKVYK